VVWLVAAVKDVVMGEGAGGAVAVAVAEAAHLNKIPQSWTSGS